MFHVGETPKGVHSEFRGSGGPDFPGGIPETRHQGQELQTSAFCEWKTFAIWVTFLPSGGWELDNDFTSKAFP